MPKVSVILPIYSKEKYLDRCINSILHQTLEDIEVILVNDGSSDNSLDICKKYEKLDDRVKVIDQENRGVSAARNSGLTIAKGQFITFVDPDDWIERNMYLRMYNHCINTQADICLCNYYKDNGKKVIPVTINCAQYILTRNEIIHEIMLNMIAPKDIDSKKNSLMGSVWRLMIKKELITKNDINFPLNIPLMEDLIFCLKVFSKATKVCIDSNHHYHYCIQEGSASTVYRSNKFELQLK